MKRVLVGLVLSVLLGVSEYVCGLSAHGSGLVVLAFLNVLSGIGLAAFLQEVMQ